MSQSYFKIAYRHLAKRKTFSAINIVGLAIGMAAFLLIIHYVQFERSYEDFHLNSQSISRVISIKVLSLLFPIVKCMPPWVNC